MVAFGHLLCRLSDECAAPRSSADEGKSILARLRSQRTRSLGPDSNALDKARKNAARLEAERDLLRATLPKFTAFAKKVSSWIEGNHSADRMQPEESDQFNAIFERGRSSRYLLSHPL